MQAHTRFVSAWRQNRSKDDTRARVDHDSAGCVQHGWARSSAALVTEVPQEGRTSVGRSRRARDVIPEFSDFSRILTELRLQLAVRIIHQTTNVSQSHLVKVTKTLNRPSS